MSAERRRKIKDDTVSGAMLPSYNLDPRKFVRLRRSTIVRAERIKELHPLFNGEYIVILKDGTQFQSSRRYRRNLDALLKG